MRGWGIAACVIVAWAMFSVLFPLRFCKLLECCRCGNRRRVDAATMQLFSTEQWQRDAIEARTQAFHVEHPHAQEEARRLVEELVKGNVTLQLEDHFLTLYCGRHFLSFVATKKHLETFDEDATIALRLFVGTALVTPGAKLSDELLAAYLGSVEDLL